MFQSCVNGFLPNVITTPISQTFFPVPSLASEVGQSDPNLQQRMGHLEGKTWLAAMVSIFCDDFGVMKFSTTHQLPSGNLTKLWKMAHL